MLLETNNFKFGRFCLNTKENILLRDGKPVSLTPKALQLLFILVENHGRIVEKKDLMKKIWEDSFVEESNLTFTISLLRKTLNDSKQNPQFIETVPKRGYRFIADVEKVFQTNGLKKTASPKTDLQIEEKRSAGKTTLNLNKNFISLAVFCILLLGIIAIGSWDMRDKKAESAASFLSANFILENLSVEGKVFDAAISPDGRKAVYILRLDNDKESVWLKQLDLNNNIEIIPSSDLFYRRIIFSPDNEYLYFSRMRTNIVDYGEPVDIYRIPAFGGVPQKVVADGLLKSISPDGKTISFIRCNYNRFDYCSLWIADASGGKNAKEIASHQNPLRIGDAAFAPDGKSIVFSIGQSLNGSTDFSLTEIDLEKGTKREFTREKFFNIKRLAWLPDKSGLLITALKHPDNNFRIWHISLDGFASQITKDSMNYSSLSIDKSANLVVATHAKADFRLEVIHADNPAINNRTLANAESASFALNEKLIFSSVMSGNLEIWSVNADGSERKQLTNTESNEILPLVSSDGKFIFFASNQTGEFQIWRMNTDGSNQIQISPKEGGFPISVSSDNKWVYYLHALNRKLWRVSVNGDQNEQLVLDKANEFFAVSPNGLQAAYYEKHNSDRFIKIVSLIDKQEIKIFQLEDADISLVRLVWMPDGKGLSYVLNDNRNQNKTIWIQSFNDKTPLKIADLGSEGIFFFAPAPNGKSFAITKGNWKHDAVLLRALK